MDALWLGTDSLNKYQGPEKAPSQGLLNQEPKDRGLSPLLPLVLELCYFEIHLLPGHEGKCDMVHA